MKSSILLLTVKQMQSKAKKYTIVYLGKQPKIIYMYKHMRYWQQTVKQAFSNTDGRTKI